MYLKSSYHKLMRFLNDNGLYKNQYGFRKRHNTIHGVTELVHNIIHGYEKGELTIGVMADVSKHSTPLIMIFCLINWDIMVSDALLMTGFEANWETVSNTCSTMTVSRTLYKALSCGVPQGSVLGPLLFLIYMNDMPNCLMTSHAILFADDTTLVVSSRDPMQLHHMNLNLDKLYNWFRSNKL